MSDIEKYELIDRYLNGDLTGRELEDFSTMLTDRSFAAEVEAQRTANHIVFENRLLELKYKLRQDHFPKSKPSGRSWMRGFLIGASLLFIAGGVYFFLKPQPENRQAALPQKEETNPSSVPETSLYQKDSALYKDTATAIVEEEPGQTQAIEEPAQAREEIKRKERTGGKSQTPLRRKDITRESTGEKQVQRIEKIEVTGNCYLTFNRAFVVTPSCEGKAEGAIQINPSAISGGEGSYEIFADRKKLKEPYRLSGIPQGKYLIRIKDKGNCMDSINISVPEKVCP